MQIKMCRLQCALFTVLHIFWELCTLPNRYYSRTGKSLIFCPSYSNFWHQLWYIKMWAKISWSESQHIFCSILDGHSKCMVNLILFIHTPVIYFVCKGSRLTWEIFGFIRQHSRHYQYTLIFQLIQKSSGSSFHCFTRGFSPLINCWETMNIVSHFLSRRSETLTFLFPYMLLGLLNFPNIFAFYFSALDISQGSLKV